MDDYRMWVVDLPSTAAAWEDDCIDGLQAALENDLAGNMLDFLDDSCESGGGPEDDDVVVDDVVIKGLTLTAEVTVNFTEVIASSCKDMPYHEHRVARFVITLRRDETVGEVVYSASDSSTWEQVDRNSNRDGT